MHSSKKQPDKWMKAIESVLNKDSLKIMVKVCGIHYTTAFYWRHKILSRLQTLTNTDKMGDFVELDEILLPLNLEGRVVEQKKKGISDQKFNVACCIDENRNIHCEASIKGRIT